jgi:hypothetical protein
MLRPEDLAQIIEIRLNEIAVELYDAEEIIDKVVFNVTADFQLYERMQKAEYELDDYQPFTPVIISRIDHTQIPANYLRYEETYQMELYGYFDQLTSLEKIFKQYAVEESTTNKSQIIDTFRVSKIATYDMNFGEEILASGGDNRSRVVGTDGGFTWNFLDGIKSSYDIEIKIDSEIMPYINYTYMDSMRPLANKEYTDTGQTNPIRSTRFYGIDLTLPYISTSPVILDIYNEFYSGVYNKTHTLSYNDGEVSFEYDVVIQDKVIVDQYPQILEFTITLVRQEAQSLVKIDGFDIPVLRFELNPESQLSTTININEDKAKSTWLSAGYTITMDVDLSDTSNETVQNLFTDVLKRNFGGEHSITFAKGLITEVFNVILESGTYSFETNPEEMMTLTFTQVDSEV